MLEAVKFEIEGMPPRRNCGSAREAPLPRGDFDGPYPLFIINKHVDFSRPAICDFHRYGLLFARAREVKILETDLTPLTKVSHYLLIILQGKVRRPVLVATTVPVKKDAGGVCHIGLGPG